MSAKPHLLLLPTAGVTGEDLDRFFERITVRKVSPEESAKNRHFCEVELPEARVHLDAGQTLPPRRSRAAGGLDDRGG